MLSFFEQAGPTAFPLVVLVLVIVGLAIYRFLQVLETGATQRPALQVGINTILFWGCFSAVLGLFGQFSGIARSLVAISEAGVVNPRLIYLGLYESFLSTLLGFVILIFASLLWLILRTLYVRLPKIAEGSAA